MAMREQFIDQKGIQVLRTWLTQFHQQDKTQMYINCLGTVLPISKVNQDAIEDLIDAGFDKLIVRHTLTAKKEDLPKFFMILRGICPKQDLAINIQLLNLVLSVVFESFGGTS